MARRKMNRDDIFDMAREAGFANVRGGLMDNGELSDYWDCWPGQLERFFHLAVAAEREACAKVCEDMGRGHGSAFAEFDCAAAIRARGEK